MSLSASSGGGSGGGSTIMTGGVANPVHQATITATVDPPVAGTVTFSIVSSTCATGVNIPASLSASSVTLVNGKAQTVLTSSDLEGAVTVRVEFAGGSQEISVNQSGGETTFTFDPIEVISDGESTMDVNLVLVQQGTSSPVPGHAISFAIVEVRDKDDSLVDESLWGDYGTLVTSQDTTDSLGTANCVLQAGTKGGCITIEATDNNDWVP